MNDSEDPQFDDSTNSSNDWIRLQVEREGTQARNIIKYNLPFSDSHRSMFGFLPPHFV